MMAFLDSENERCCEDYIQISDNIAYELMLPEDGTVVVPALHFLRR